MEIRLATIQDLMNIEDLLNKVTLMLHNRGVNQWSYPCNKKELEIDIENNRVFVLIIDNLIIGTYSLKNIQDIYLIPVETNNKYLYRIAILPEYQGQGLGVHMVNYCCNYAKDNNKILYLDCWGGNEKLRSFYSSIGFNLIGDFSEEDYMVSVFKFT